MSDDRRRGVPTPLPDDYTEPQRTPTPTGRFERARSEHSDQIRRIELLAAEVFGVDGHGGRFKRLEDTVDKHAHEIDGLKTFRAQALALIAAGALVAGLIGKLIERLL